MSNEQREGFDQITQSISPKVLIDVPKLGIRSEPTLEIFFPNLESKDYFNESYVFSDGCGLLNRPIKALIQNIDIHQPKIFTDITELRQYRGLDLKRGAFSISNSGEERLLCLELSPRFSIRKESSCDMKFFLLIINDNSNGTYTEHFIYESNHSLYRMKSTIIDKKTKRRREIDPYYKGYYASADTLDREFVDSLVNLGMFNLPESNWIGL